MSHSPSTLQLALLGTTKPGLVEATWSLEVITSQEALPAWDRLGDGEAGPLPHPRYAL